MKKAIAMTKQEFESSCHRTPEYLAWHKLFKREMTAYLKSLGAETVEIFSPNHFDMSGFFLKNQQWVYFSLSDLRWSKDDMLVRTAKNNKDYTGGTNNFVSLQDFDTFDRQMRRVLERITV